MNRNVFRANTEKGMKRLIIQVFETRYYQTLVLLTQTLTREFTEIHLHVAAAVIFGQIDLGPKQKYQT